MNKSKTVASPVLRFLAFVIDFLLWCLFYLMVLLMAFSSNDINMILDSIAYGVLFMILISFIAPLINSYLTSKFGGSLGKLLCGIRVVNEDFSSYLSFWYAFLRTSVGYAISGMLMGLGYFWIVIDKKRQGWHDMIVGSVVIVTSKWSYLIAVISLTLLILINSYLVSSIYKNFQINKPFYETIINDIKQEYENYNNEQESTPSEKEFDAGEIGMLH